MKQFIVQNRFTGEKIVFEGERPQAGMLSINPLCLPLKMKSTEAGDFLYMLETGRTHLTNVNSVLKIIGV